MYRYVTFNCECGHRWEEFLRTDEIPQTLNCSVCGGQAQRGFGGCPALVGTDSQYYAGKGLLAKQFGNDGDMKVRLNQAKKHGFVPPASAVYEPGLADFPGDPKAFITEGQSQIKRRLREMQAKKTRPAVPLAENIVRRYARKMVKENPSLKSLPKQEVRERVIEKHRARIV